MSLTTENTFHCKGLHTSQVIIINILKYSDHSKIVDYRESTIKCIFRSCKNEAVVWNDSHLIFTTRTRTSSFSQKLMRRSEHSVIHGITGTSLRVRWNCLWRCLFLPIKYRRSLDHCLWLTLRWQTSCDTSLPRGLWRTDVSKAFSHSLKTTEI